MNEATTRPEIVRVARWPRKAPNINNPMAASASQISARTGVSKAAIVAS